MKVEPDGTLTFRHRGKLLEVYVSVEMKDVASEFSGCSGSSVVKTTTDLSQVISNVVEQYIKAVEEKKIAEHKKAQAATAIASEPKSNQIVVNLLL